MVTLFAAGTPPDIVYMNEWIPSLVDAGFLAPLDEFIARDQIDLSQLFPPVLEMGRINGKLYALPQEISPVVMYYNYDYVNQAGLARPSDDWDWDEFLNFAKKLTRERGDHTVWGHWPEWYWWGGWGPWIYSNGGRIWSEDKTRSEIGAVEAVEAIDFVAGLGLEHGVAPPLEITYDDWMVEAFMRGEVATISAGMWVLPMFANPEQQIRLDFDWDVVLMPQQRRQATVAASLSYGISSTSPYKEEAWEFIKFMTMTDEGQSYVVSTGMALPTLRSSESIDAFREYGYRIGVENIDAFIGGAETSEFEMFVPQFAEAHGIINGHMWEAFVGQAPAHSTLGEASRSLTALINE